MLDQNTLKKVMCGVQEFFVNFYSQSGLKNQSETRLKVCGVKWHFLKLRGQSELPHSLRAIWVFSLRGKINKNYYKTAEI